MPSTASPTRRGGVSDTAGARPSHPLDIDRLVADTPASRDRSVDFLRALSIAVVVLWHWVFSITQWNDDGSLGMPNPIGDVPGLWLATWLLQIMPVFFFVGGFANLASFEAVERRGGGWLMFVQGRLRRLIRPVAVFVGLWAAGDATVSLLVPSYTGVRHWGMVVFVPLWFLGVYTGVVLLAPLMIRLHRSGRELTTLALLGIVVLGDLARFRWGLDGVGIVTSAFVWIFVHQLGFWWRDGTLTRCARRTQVTLALGGLLGLVVLTNLGVYPRSMVSVRGEGSNLFPTTACIAALAVFQLGIVLLLRPWIERGLARRGPWRVTVAVNAIAMTVFTWHMTALVAAIGLYQLGGGTLLREASGTWWLQRPIWLLLPGALLAVLVYLFRRFELPRPGR